MMNFVVKNTTIRRLLDLFCPNTCLSCGRVGANLCECCKKNIKWLGADELRECVVKVDRIVWEWGGGVKNEVDSANRGGDSGVSGDDVVLDGLFAVGERSGVLEKMMHKYKFMGDRFLVDEIAGMMCERILGLAGEVMRGDGVTRMGDGSDFNGGDGVVWKKMRRKVVVTAVPTIPRHVRERGFDHAGLLAEEIAARLGCEYQEIFERRKNTVQVGADGETRKKQAKIAYEIKNEAKIAPERVYLVVDDVWTTGASVAAAAMKLKRKGALSVFGAVFLVGK